MGLSSSKEDTGPQASSILNFKIVVLGLPTSGKTSVVKRYIDNRFDEYCTQTEKVEIREITRRVNLPDSRLVSLSFWDCPSKEDIDLRHIYYRDADAAIVVGDLTNAEFLTSACAIKDDFFEIAKTTVHHYTKVKGIHCDDPTYAPIAADTPVTLLGNKYDLIQSEKNSVADWLAAAENDHGFAAGILVSCKWGKWGDGSIAAAVQGLVRHLIQKRVSKQVSEVPKEVEKKVSKKTKESSHTSTGFDVFETTGLSEVDEQFNHLIPLMQRETEWQFTMTQCARFFRLLCVRTGLSKSEEENWSGPLGGFIKECRAEFEGFKIVERYPNDELLGGRQFPTGEKIPRLLMIKLGVPLDDLLPQDIEKSYRKFFPSESSTRDVAIGGSESDLSHESTSSQGNLIQLTKTETLALIVNYFNTQLSPACWVAMVEAPAMQRAVDNVDSNIRDLHLHAKLQVMAGVERNRVRATRLSLEADETMEMANEIYGKLITLLLSN